MSAFADLVRFIPTAGGTGDWVFANAVAGCQSPTAANVQNGVSYKVYAISTDQSQWEISTGIYDSATGTFPRTTVLANSLDTGTETPGQSGAGTLINFTTIPQVALVALAEDLISVEVAQSFTTAQQAQARSNIGAAVNELQNVSFTVSASAGALTIALKDANGNDPTSATPIALSFRNASLTASPNTPTTVEVTAATSVVLPSTSTIGFASATAGRLWVCGWNDGGTFRLGVFNASTATRIFPLAENGVASSSLIGTGSTAAGTHYTAGAAVTSKAFRILGFVEWGASGMTAGTWTTTNLAAIQTFGPGIPRPGMVIGGPAITTASGRTTGITATSYTSTALTASYSMQSAANLLKVTWVGGVQVSNSGLNIDVAARMINNAATQVSNEIEVFTGNVSQLGVGTTIVALDKPNSLSSLAYTMQAKIITSGNTVFLGSTSLANTGSTFIFEELMG